MVLIAFEEAAVEGSATLTVDSHILRYAFLQAGSGHDDLESRTRSELILNGLVHQRVARVGDELVPVIALDLDGKGVGIIAGVRNEGQHFAVTRVHDDDRAVSLAESQLRGALDVKIDGELEILARGRML